jgi:hypothetical protein
MEEHKAPLPIQITEGRGCLCGLDSRYLESALPGLQQTLHWPAQGINRQPGGGRPTRLRHMGDQELPRQEGSRRV